MLSRVYNYESRWKNIAAPRILVGEIQIQKISLSWGWLAPGFLISWSQTLVFRKAFKFPGQGANEGRRKYSILITFNVWTENLLFLELFTTFDISALRKIMMNRKPNPASLCWFLVLTDVVTYFHLTSNMYFRKQGQSQSSSDIFDL